jgi:hypothetical protein
MQPDMAFWGLQSSLADLRGLLRCTFNLHHASLRLKRGNDDSYFMLQALTSIAYHILLIRCFLAAGIIKEN